jgi:hypothetical protein
MAEHSSTARIWAFTDHDRAGLDQPQSIKNESNSGDQEYSLHQISLQRLWKDIERPTEHKKSINRRRNHS